MFSICVGRLLENGFVPGVAFRNMFLNAIHVKIMVLMLRIRENSCEITFSAVVQNMSNIGLCNLFREYIDACIEFVSVDCASTVVSGARPCMVTHTTKYCNVWIAEMLEVWWLLKHYSIYWFIYIRFFSSEEPNITVSSGKRQAKHVDTWAFVMEKTVIRHMLTSTGPLSDLRYMFRQTKEGRQAAEPVHVKIKVSKWHVHEACEQCYR